MSTLTNSSYLLRLLLSLITRLRLSARSIALALRTVPGSLWRWILAFARFGRQSRIRLSASNVRASPVMQQEHQVPDVEVEMVQDTSTSLAKSPPEEVTWQSRLSTLRDLTSTSQLAPFSFQHAIPGSQRYALDNSSINNLPLFADYKAEIPAGQQTLVSSLSPLPPRWKRYVHPEGVCLFYHEDLRILTEHDIGSLTKEKEIILCAMKLVERAIQTNGITLDKYTEIVLNLDRAQPPVCHYYFVDHTQRLLFWVDPVGVKDLNIHPRKNSGYNHIKYKVESYYWVFQCNFPSRSHCEYYPHTSTISQEVVKELRGMLSYAKIDTITTDSSSSPFGQDELVAMLALLDTIKGSPPSFTHANVTTSSKDDTGKPDAYETWAIARLMTYLTENQFINFCGQTCARLNADTSLFKKPDWNRRLAFRLINLLLLGSPNKHALRLQRVWVDGTIIQPRWKDFVNRITSELGRYTIFSTVMLAVSFSFLALPGVIAVGAGAGAVQIIIYCSIVSTIASIVFSFGLLNVYTTPRLLNAGNVTQAFGALSRTKTGMASIAITHSLPMASLVWSITFFSVALAVQIFSPKEPATVAALSVEISIILLCVFVAVRVMRHFSRDGGDGGDGGDGSTDVNAPLPAKEKPSRNDGLIPDDVERGYHRVESHAASESQVAS